jgi:hypothetical protein
MAGREQSKSPTSSSRKIKVTWESTEEIKVRAMELAEY